MVATFSPDTRTSWFLTNEPGAEHHAVPCLELIPFSVSEDLAFMVMPRMRECCDPPWFATVREFVEFAQQVLEASRIFPAIVQHSRIILYIGPGISP
jgi:hypothetical protein